MTIKQEALRIAKNFQGTKMDSYAIALLQEQVGKALKAKQDRIEDLEKKLELEKEERNRWQDSACRLEGNLDTALSTIDELEKERLNLKYVSRTSRDFMRLTDQDKHLKKIAELEHLLQDHSDEVLRTCYQKIKTLEGALSWAFEQFVKIEGCHMNCEQPTEQEEREVHHMFRLAQEGIQFIKDAKKALGGGA